MVDGAWCAVGVSKNLEYSQGVKMRFQSLTRAQDGSQKIVCPCVCVLACENCEQGYTRTKAFWGLGGSRLQPVCVCVCVCVRVCVSHEMGFEVVQVCQ